jgi:hypothetical protein
MKKSAHDLRYEINALRIEAGLAPSNTMYGTSLSSLQVILNLAQAGKFSPNKPPKRLNNAQLAREIESKLYLGQGHIRVSKGQFKIYKGFFWTPKQSEPDWAATITEKLKENGFPLSFVEICGDHYRPFKGGAPVHLGSHYCAVFNRTDIPA